MSAGKISKYLTQNTTTARLYNFDVSSDALKREHESWLAMNVVPLLYSGGSLTVIGLTSRSGTGEYNLELSRRRTDSLVRFLRTHAGNKFKVIVDSGLGEVVAQVAGERNGGENEIWRAVVLSAWNRPEPPPPPPRKPLPRLPSSSFEKVDRRVAASFMYEHKMSHGVFSGEDNSGPEKSANASRNIQLYRQLKAGGSPVQETKQPRLKTAEVVFITVSRNQHDPAFGDMVGGDTQNYCYVQYEWREEYSSKGPILLSHFYRPSPDEPGVDRGPEAYRLTDAMADLWLNDPPKAWTELRGNTWDKVDAQTVLRELVESKSR